MAWQQGSPSKYVGHSAAGLVSRQHLTCGTACAAALLKELEAREREAGIKPDAGVDAFLRARLRGGITGSMSTEMVLSLLGLTASPLCSSHAIVQVQLLG